MACATQMTMHHCDVMPSTVNNTLYIVRQKKHTKFFFIITEERLSNLINFWYTYFKHNWPSNGCSVSHLTQRLLLHYQEKTEQTKCALKSTKNLIKFHLSRYVTTISQSITRFDCCAAARLLNRPNIQEY